MLVTLKRLISRSERPRAISHKPLPPPSISLITLSDRIGCRELATKSKSSLVKKNGKGGKQYSSPRGSGEGQGKIRRRAEDLVMMEVGVKPQATPLLLLRVWPLSLCRRGEWRVRNPSGEALTARLESLAHLF